MKERTFLLPEYFMMNKALTAVAVLVLAACGDKSKDDAAMAKMDSTTTAAPTPTMAASPAPNASQDIIETAASAGMFTTLATALTAAGLVETLKGAGPFTVLAPTDEAFAKIPAADLQALLADKTKLTKVLTYHVISGDVPSSQISTMSNAKTLEGSEVSIKMVDGKVMLNGTSTVTSADVKASNGVIHVINTVLMPPK